MSFKRIFPALVGAFLALMLCACSADTPESAQTYTVTRNNVSYVIDREQCTISDGTYLYQYSISGTTATVTFPDGSSYWWGWHHSGNISSGYGGWSDDYDETRYTDGRTLCDLVLDGIPQQDSDSHSNNLFIALILLAVGIFNVVSPHTAWYLSYGWRYKNAEPSDMALGLGRLGGIAAIVIALILVFT